MDRMYCTVDDVIFFTGIEPEEFGLELGEMEKLRGYISKWIIQATDMIDSYCHKKQDINNIPPTVENACLRIVTRMIALSRSHMNGTVLKADDWTVNQMPSDVFTDAIKKDLEPYTKKDVRQNKSMINLFVIKGRKNNGNRNNCENT